MIVLILECTETKDRLGEELLAWLLLIDSDEIKNPPQFFCEGFEFIEIRNIQLWGGSNCCIYLEQSRSDCITGGTLAVCIPAHRSHNGIIQDCLASAGRNG